MEKERLINDTLTEEQVESLVLSGQAQLSNMIKHFQPISNRLINKLINNGRLYKLDSDLKSYILHVRPKLCESLCKFIYEEDFRILPSVRGISDNILLGMYGSDLEWLIIKNRYYANNYISRVIVEKLKPELIDLLEIIRSQHFRSDLLPLLGYKELTNFLELIGEGISPNWRNKMIILDQDAIDTIESVGVRKSLVNHFQKRLDDFINLAKRKEARTDGKSWVSGWIRFGDEMVELNFPSNLISVSRFIDKVFLDHELFAFNNCYHKYGTEKLPSELEFNEPVVKLGKCPYEYDELRHFTLLNRPYSLEVAVNVRDLLYLSEKIEDDDYYILHQGQTRLVPISVCYLGKILRHDRTFTRYV